MFTRVRVSTNSFIPLETVPLIRTCGIKTNLALIPRYFCKHLVKAWRSPALEICSAYAATQFRVREDESVWESSRLCFAMFWRTVPRVRIPLGSRQYLCCYAARLPKHQQPTFRQRVSLSTPFWRESLSLVEHAVSPCNPSSWVLSPPFVFPLVVFDLARVPRDFPYNLHAKHFIGRSQSRFGSGARWKCCRARRSIRSNSRSLRNS